MPIRCIGMLSNPETTSAKFKYKDLEKYEEILDNIAEGKKYYPVCSLCRDYEFDIALSFVRRGYLWTHKGYEAREIYNIIEAVRRIAPFECDVVEYITGLRIDVCEELSKEVEGYDEARSKYVAQEIRQMLIGEYLRYKDDFIMALIRFMPNIYRYVTDSCTDTLDMILACCNQRLTKDCFDKFNTECHVKSFDSSKENHMILETRKALIYKYRPYDNYVDTIISVQEFTGVFSDNFMSDFALMCTILKLRELNVYSRKVYCMRSRELYYEQDVNTVLEELKEILLRYMPTQYVLSNIVHCLSGNYEEFYNDNPGHRVGNAMDCFADTDVIVMEQLSLVAQSKGSKLLISEKEIEGIYDVWCSNNNPDKMIPVDMYKLTMFQDWLAKNCLVST